MGQQSSNPSLACSHVPQALFFTCARIHMCDYKIDMFSPFRCTSPTHPTLSPTFCHRTMTCHSSSLPPLSPLAVPPPHQPVPLPTYARTNQLESSSTQLPPLLRLIPTCSTNNCVSYPSCTHHQMCAHFLFTPTQVQTVPHVQGGGLVELGGVCRCTGGGGRPVSRV